MKYFKFILFILSLAIALSFSAHAQPKLAEEKGSEIKLSVEMTEGEIRKIDKDAKKITIKHGEIKHLEMPSMTMVFQVKDAALLEQVKVGDKVKFAVEQTGGALVVTEIQPAK